MCRLSWNLGASTFWNPQGLSRPVMGMLYLYLFFCCGAATQRGLWPSSFLRFLDHTQRRTTVGRTPLDEWSARRRDLYLTTHNTHNRQTFMPPVGFEPTISAGELPQTYALDRATTGTGLPLPLPYPIKIFERCGENYLQILSWMRAKYSPIIRGARGATVTLK